MPLLTTIGAVLATKFTLSYLTESIIDHSAVSVIQNIPKLGERLKKQFSGTRPEVNGHLQKAILSSHWMATLVFVEQMHKKNLLSEAYYNVHQTIKKELKLLSDENYHPEENSPDAYDAAKLIKLPKEKEIVRKLRETILDFHSSQLDQKTGNVKSLKDYLLLLNYIRTGWSDENLDWFSLMTAFLNQLLKGDNNNARDAFQNQTLATIQLKLNSFENYATSCIEGIGEERFRTFEEAVFAEIGAIRDSLTGLHKKQEEIFNEVILIKTTVLEIKNKMGESRQLNLNVFEQYREAVSDIEALKVAIETLEQEKRETGEFIAEEQDNRKKARFEKDYISLDSEQLSKQFILEGKRKQLDEFSVNIQRTWLSLYAEDTPRLREARQAMEAGDLEGANNVLDDKALQNDFDLIENLDAVLLKRKESLAQEYITKAGLTVVRKTSGDWFDLTDQYYKKATAIYPSYHTYFNSAFFLANHNQFVRAISSYEKAAIFSSNDDERSTVLNNLGNLQRAQKEFDKAEKNYNEARKFYTKLAQREPENPTHLSYVAAIQVNLGTLYLGQEKYEQAEKNYIQARKIYLELDKDKLQTYLPYTTGILNSLAIIEARRGLAALDIKKIKRAERIFNEALKTRKKLAEETPDTYLPQVVETLQCIGILKYGKGILQRDQEEFVKAEKNYCEALKIKKRLAQDNPYSNLPGVAAALDQLGQIYRAQKKFDDAAKSLLEALRFRRELANHNPKMYLSEVVETLNSLGDLYRDQQEPDKAEKSYTDSLQIGQELAASNPARFSDGYIGTLVNLAILYSYDYQKNKEKSLTFAQMAIQYCSPFLVIVPRAVICQKIAERIILGWENEKA